MDVHNLAAMQNAFRCRTENLEAGKLFAEFFLPLLRANDTNGTSDVVVVSPDAGGIKRAERFRRTPEHSLGKPVGMAFAEKHRSDGRVSGELLAGDVGGKTAVIVDDLISTGGTLARTARACRAHGAATVHAAATHGLFTQDAPDILADDTIDRIVVTDTVPPLQLPEEGAVRQKTTVLDSTALFAKALRRMHDGGSVTELLEF